MYYPEKMMARVSHEQSIEPHRISAPTRDLNQGPAGSTVQRSHHCTIAAQIKNVHLDIGGNCYTQSFLLVDVLYPCSGKQK